MRRWPLLLALCLALAGCGWKGSGTVVQKDYDRPYTSYTDRCTTRTIGTTKTRTCTKDPVYHPASWSLLVRDDKDGTRHWVTVSEFEYNRQPVGSHYRNG